MRTVNYNVDPFIIHAGEEAMPGGATLAVWPAGDERKLANNLLDATDCYIAIAQCNPKDKYSRGKGRKLARERGFLGDGVFIQFPKNYDISAKRQMLYEMAGILAGH